MEQVHGERVHKHRRHAQEGIVRTAVKACEAGEIKGYPDLELINIDRFVTDIEEVPWELIVNVDRVLEDLGRVA